jgi:GTP-binding protein Era
MNAALHYCGYVTILGRPNVGKSTLLNLVLGQKISITSRKPQTTRLHLLGVKSKQDKQIIYVDTPGIQLTPVNLIGRHMNREALNSIEGVNVLVFMIEAMSWTDADEYILNIIKECNMPIIMVINKIDKIKEKHKLLPFIDKISKKHQFKNVIPLSALVKDNALLLENCIEKLLPAAPPLFPDDQLSDKSEQFFAAEYIREKLTRSLGDELPYQINVTIENFVEENKLIKVSAIIWVATESQKAITIGKDGLVLKTIGEQARKDMEKLFEKKVFLETWVKVKDKWMDSVQALKQFGYDF